MFHPQFLVRRDLGGDAATASSPPTRPPDDPAVLPESWMHLEILPPARPEAPYAGRRRPGAGPARGAPAGRGGGRGLAEDDHPRRGDHRACSSDPVRTAGRREEAALARELLGWLNANHFTFLGYREYALVATPTRRARRSAVRPGPGHRPGHPARRRRRARAPSAPCRRRAGAHDLMVITKDNYKSRVHRPAYLDYLGIRIFDADGRVIGERRFLGLFSSSAYSESVTRVPVLRQKAAGDPAALRLRASSSHGGKAIMDVLETYPRDELFQARMHELAADGGEGRPPQGTPPGPAVRPPRPVRPLPVLPGLPAPGPLHHRGPAADGGDPAAPARRRVDRLHRPGAASRCWPGCTSWSGCRWARRWARSTYAALERELTLATRSWNDEFADLIAERRRPGTAGHPGRRAAGGLQGGLHAAAGDPGPRRP